MAKLLIWGAAGQAKVVADAALRMGGWQIAGFIDDVSPGRRGEVFFAGASVLGGRERLDEWREQGVTSLFLAFGDNAARLALAATCNERGFEFPSIVHPHASVSASAIIGAGSYVAPGAVVNACARIGAQVIVNSGAVVEHDCVVEDGAHVGPRACVGGLAQVGRGAWIGAGAVLRDRIEIGAGTQVGMGAVVVRSLPAGVVAWGCPAAIVRQVQGK